MGMPPNNYWDAVPEFDQHEVRYSEYVLKSSKKPVNPVLPKKRKFLVYGVGPTVDAEIDEDDDNIDFSKYVLPRFDTEDTETTHSAEEKLKQKKKKNLKGESSLDSIYEELRKVKLSKIRKILKASATEFSLAQKNRPSLSFLSLAKQFYSTMFNPDQKYWIYTCIRNMLNIPPHSFRDVSHIFTVLAPKAAVIIFQKMYKIDSIKKAVGKLGLLELLNPTFYSDKAKVNIYCRT